MRCGPEVSIQPDILLQSAQTIVGIQITRFDANTVFA